MRFRSGRAVSSLLVLALTVGATPTPPGQQERFQSVVDVFRFQLALVDEDGDFVPGLRAQDLELRVNGASRPIVDLVEIDALALEPPAAAVASETAAETPVAAIRDVTGPTIDTAARRRFLLFLDLTTMDSRTLRYARDAATDFLEELASPADMVGLATYSPRMGLRYEVPFTTDRQQILERTTGLSLGRATEAQRDSTLSLAGLREEAELAEAVALLEELDNARLELNANSLMLVLGDLAEALAPIEGRKHVLFFSSGLSDLMMEKTSVVQDMQATTRRALAADVVFHALQPSILPASSEHDVANMQSTFRPGSLRGFNENFTGLAGRQFLHFIADETGGTASFFRHRLRNGMETVEESSRRYYTLAFRLLPEDGEQIDLEIVPRRPEVSVAWAPSTLTVPAAGAGSTLGRQIDLADAIEIGNDDAAMALDPLVVQQAPIDGYGRAAVFLEIPYPQLLALAEERGTDAIELEFLGLALTPWGEVADYFRGRLQVDEVATRLAARPGPLRYQNLIAVPAGTYMLKMIVRDPELGHLASRTYQFTVNPDPVTTFTVGEPLVLARASDGFLVRGVSPESTPEHRVGRPLDYPVTIRGNLLVPAAAPEATAGGTFDVLVTAYQAMQHPFTGEPALTVEPWLEDPAGNRVALPDFDLLASEYVAGRAEVRLLLRVAVPPATPAGPYTLATRVLDGIANIDETSRATIRITPE